jgi:hypothetical protein
LGEQYDLPTAYMGLTVSKLSDYVGSQVNALIGADVLSKTCFAIDWRSHRIDFSDTPLDYEGHTVVMTSFMGIPMVELNVCDTKIRAFLDTGAKISYLNAEITQGRDKGRTVTDFYPGIGRFETPTFRIPIALNDVVFRVVFGNLPRVLEMSLMLAGAQGILGNDIFRYFSVYFDIQRSKITLRRRRKH